MALLRIKNKSAYSRTGVVTLGIPFSKAENIRETDNLIVAGAYSSVAENQKVQWYPQGARWDNGAVKYARVSFKTNLTANEEKIAAVLRSNDSVSIPYTRTNVSWSGLQSTVATISIEGTTYQIPFQNLELIEGGGPTDHYSRYRVFTHLPNSPTNPRIRHFWIDFVAEFFSDLNYVQFYFRFGFYRFSPSVTPSSPDAVDPRYTLTQPIILEINGPTTAFRFENEKIQEIQTITSTHKRYTLISPGLHGGKDALLVPGISHAYKGVMCFGTPSGGTLSAELDSQILAISDDWKTLFPITGTIPDNSRHTYLTDETEKRRRSDLLLQNISAVSSTSNPYRGPYNWPAACNTPRTTNTGTHGYRDYAFGLRGWPIFDSSNYNWIPYLEFTTRQQALRTNWYYKDDGSVVTPNELLSAQVHIWSGMMFGASPASFAGYTVAAGESNLPYAANNSHGGQPIYGPDKEHYTNTMFFLQALISMDWYSLEYMKMYVAYYINANRVDSYPSYAASSIHSWGSPRAIGRTSQNAAMLYEFTADQELKYWLQRRYDFNIQQRGRLARQYTPGLFTEKIRGTEVLGVCDKAACLNSFRHWRPWEEGAACLGNYLLAKVLLTEDPTSTLGAQYLQLSRDAAASLVLGNTILDCTPGTGIASFTIGPAPVGSTELAQWITNNGFALGRMITGQTSGATGRLVLVHYAATYASAATRYLQFWVKDVQGTFQPGEYVRLDTSLLSTQPIYERFDFWGAMSQNLEITTNTADFGRLLNINDALEVTTVQDNNYPVSMYPFGYFRNARYSRSYPVVISPAVSIALEAASQNYYPDSNELIKQKATELRAKLFTSYAPSNPTDYDEYIECFMGYVGTLTEIPDTIINFNVTKVQANFSIKQATASITNPIRNTTATNSSTPRVIASTTYPNVTTSTVIDTSTSPIGSRIRSRTSTHIARGSAVASGLDSSSILISAQDADLIYTTIIDSSKRKYVYVYVGDPESADTLVRDAPEEQLIDPPANVGYAESIFHRVEILNTIGFPVTDYVLVNPINRFGDALGESIGLNGQILRTQGYTWYSGSQSEDPWDEETIEISTPELTHTIKKARRGNLITGWNVRSESGYDWDFDIVRRKSPEFGLNFYEKYITINNPTRTYTPSFGGSKYVSENMATINTSPVRYSNITQLQRGKKIEGAVTPIDRDYTLAQLGTNNQLIAYDMKQYYCLSVDCNSNLPGVSQLDFWSFHYQTLPSTVLNTSTNLELNITTAFNDIELVVPDTGFVLNLGDIYRNKNTTVEITRSSIVSNSGANFAPTTYPSIFYNGYFGIIYKKADHDFCMGVVGYLHDKSYNCTKPTGISLTNRLSITEDEEDVDSSAGHSFTLYSRGINQLDSSRRSGWLGLRTYIIFGTVEEVRQKMSLAYEQGILDKDVHQQGLLVYERPAII